MLDNITSGDEYAKIIVESLIETELSLPQEDRMSPDLFSSWIKNITKDCNNKWLDYITGKIETYLLTDDDITEAYQKASKELLSETLSGLFEKEMIKISVGENGEILYSLTEKGKEEAQKINNS